MERAVFILLVVVCSYGLIQGNPVCNEDEYFSKSTGNCDPCSVLCDPPNPYIKACPENCPNYKPRPPSTTSAPKFGDSPNVVLIAVLCVGVLILLLLACLLTKYWEILRNFFTTYILRNKENDDIRFPVQEQSRINNTEGSFGNTARVDGAVTVDIVDE